MSEIYNAKFYLNASECNAQRQISLPMLVQRLIEVATDHASALGVGYEDLRKQQLAWVLSRLSLQMESFPSIDRYYCIETWVASINKRFTERCFSITDGETGSQLGFAHTVWFAIDMIERRGADLTDIMKYAQVVQRSFPISRGSKLPAVTAPQLVRNHRFSFCDIDFNRHVNSTRYIEALLNDRSVEFYDQHHIKHFEIAYLDEIHFNDMVEIKRSSVENVSNYEITRDGVAMTRARITYDSPQLD